MRARRAVLAGGLVLASVVAVPGPAVADADSDYGFVEHAPGYPATEQAALRLESGWAARSQVTNGPDRVTAAVTLQGEPDAGTDAVLDVVLGVAADDGSCGARWSVRTSTLAPSVAEGTAERDGRTIQVTAPDTSDGEHWDCGHARLTDGSGAVTDLLVGRYEGTTIGDRFPGVRVEVTGTRVRPGRWATVPVRLRLYNAHGPRSVRITGHGRDVRVGTVRRYGVREDRTVVVRVPVRLAVHAPRRVVLRVVVLRTATTRAMSRRAQFTLSPRR